MKNSIQHIANCLLEGGVVLIPTDTVYGLASLPTSEKGIAKLYAMKERPRERKLPIMVAEVEQLEGLGIIVNEAARKVFASKYSPGAVTVAMGVQADKVDWLEGREEVAIRIPNDERLLAVLRATGPLFVTSANRHGQPTPDTVVGILEQLANQPDLAIDGGHLKQIPSTLINCNLETPRVEREGVIAAQDLMDLL